MAKRQTQDPLDVTGDDIEQTQGADAAQPPAAAAAAAPTKPAPVDYQDRPQGIVPRKMDTPHPVFGKAMGIKMLDPESLKVRRKHPVTGEDFLDDPYLALPAPDGKPDHITQVRADHAAYMLTCDPRSGGTPTARLATDEEVAEHLKVHGLGGHGNVVKAQR